MNLSIEKSLVDLIISIKILANKVDQFIAHSITLPCVAMY